MNTSDAPGSRRRAVSVALAGMAGVALIGLQACRSTAPGTPVPSTVPGGPLTPEAPPAGVPPAPSLPAEAPLVQEARWLSELFAGTPVQIAGEPDGSVRILVPLKFSFDPGTPTTVPSSTPKAPLQAVLDKLAQSLKRHPTSRLQAAPPGPSANERLAAIRAYLVSKGVPLTRVVQGSSAGDDQVLLRLTPPTSPTSGVKKVDDQNLRPAGARRVIPPGGIASATSASSARR